MLRKSVPPVGGPIRDQTFCDGSAAFLNESIIREIIKGMYLEWVIVSCEQEIMSQTQDVHENTTERSEERHEGGIIDDNLVITYGPGRS